MRTVGFATLLVLTFMQTVCRAQASAPASAVYLLSNSDGFVQYVSLAISGNVATGFLEDVRYDADAQAGLDQKRVPLSGTAIGNVVVIGTWTAEASAQKLAITFPTRTGELSEARFDRSSASAVNAAIHELTNRAMSLQTRDRSNGARAEIARANALDNTDAANVAQMQVALAALVEKNVAAQRSAAAAIVLARTKHRDAEAAVQAAKNAGALRAAAAQVEAAMNLDVVSAREQAYLTQSNADVAVATDDLKVLRGQMAMLERRVQYLRGVVAREYAPTVSPSWVPAASAPGNGHVNSGVALEP